MMARNRKNLRRCSSFHTAMSTTIKIQEKNAKSNPRVFVAKNPGQVKSPKITKGKRKNNSKRKIVKAQFRPKSILNKLERRVRGSEDVNLSNEQKQYLKQCILPYCTKPVRVIPSNTRNHDACAITKHTVSIPLDLTLLGTNRVQGTMGTYTQPVWSDLTKGIPVVSIMDPYVVGIIPSLREPDLAVEYLCVQFAGRDMVDNAYTFSAAHVNFDNDLHPVAFYPQTANMPYGDVHPVVDMGNKTTVWIDANNSQSAVVQVRIIMDNFTGGSPILDTHVVDEEDTTEPIVVRTSFSIVAGSLFEAVLELKTSGYYSFKLVGDAAFTGGNNLVIMDRIRVITGVEIVSRHIVNENIMETTRGKQLFEKAYVTAHSLLMTNTTASIALAGKVYAVTDYSEKPWTYYTSDPQTTIVDASIGDKKYDGNWKKGIYAWTRRDVDGGYRNLISKGPVATSNAKIHSYVADCNPNNVGSRCVGKNMIYVTNLSKVLDTQQTAKLTFTVVFQYTTTNQTPDLSSDAMPSNILLQAEDILAEFPSFSPNETHLEAFTNMVRNATNRFGGMIARARPYVVPIAQVMKSFPHPLASTIGRLLEGFY